MVVPTFDCILLGAIDPTTDFVAFESNYDLKSPNFDFKSAFPRPSSLSFDRYEIPLLTSEPPPAIFIIPPPACPAT